MSTQFGNAKIRIELDPREAEEALARLQAKVAGLDRSLAGGDEEGKPRREGQSGDSQSSRRGGDSPSYENGAPDNRSAWPGRFGIQNVRGLLSAPGLLGAVPVVGGSLRFMSEMQMKYGAAAEGMVAGLTGELLKSSGMEDSAGGEIMDRVTKLVLQMQEGMRNTIQTLDSKLRAIEPALEAVLTMGRGQLLTSGALDTGFLTKYSAAMFGVQSDMLWREKDIRDKSLREVSEAGGAELIKSLMSMSKR